MAEEGAKYRVSYALLIAYMTFQDFDTLSEARVYARKCRADEALFIKRHRSQLPTITKVLERVV